MPGARSYDGVARGPRSPAGATQGDVGARIVGAAGIVEAEAADALGSRRRDPERSEPWARLVRQHRVERRPGTTGGEVDVDRPTGHDGGSGRGRAVREPEPTASAPDEPEVAVPAAPAPEPQERLLLVWTPGALPDGAAAAIDSLDLVESVSVGGGGVVDLVTSHHADGEPVDRLEAGWGGPTRRHPGDVDLLGAMDEPVLTHAAEAQRVLLAADTDFGELLALTGATAPSVLLLRGRGRRPRERAASVRDAIQQTHDALERGALVVVEETRLRVQELPITEPR